MTVIDKKYFAFISYKREDEAWAKWLQHKLEHYKLPSNLNGRSDLPKEIRPIFRDTSDLAGGVLAEEIKNALENSQYLIVICSPRAAQSEWVGKEVQSFIEMGRIDKIIPFIVGGAPYSENVEEECFPLSLRKLPKEQELLGVNINEMGRDAAAVKVVASMFGLQFDELWQRQEREKRRRRSWIISASIIGFLVMTGVAGWIWRQNVEIKEKDWKMMEEQSRLVSEKIKTTAKNDSYLARIIALSYLLNNKYDNENYVPEFESALRTATTYNSAVFVGHTAAVTSTFFSNDGQYILSTSYDKTIKLWDASNGVCLKTFYGHSNHVNKAVFNHDLSKIASCSDDKTVIIWDIDSLKILNTLYGHENGVYSVAFSPDGKHLLSSSRDKTIRIWDVVTGECLKVLKGHEKMVECAVYSPDGQKIVSASADRTVKVWDANRGVCIKTLFGHQKNVQSVEFSPDGRYIVSASVDCTVKIWDFDTMECIHTLKGHTKSVQYASFSNDGNMVASSSDDATTRLWDVTSGNCMEILKGHTIYVTSPHFSPDSKRIVTGSVDYTVRVWDVGNVDGSYDKVKSFNIYSVKNPPSYSQDGQHITCYSNDSIWVCDVLSGERLSAEKTSNVNANICPESNVSMTSHDGKEIITIDINTICVSDIKTGKRLRTFLGHTAKIYGFTLSDDDKYLITVSHDSTIKIWDYKSGVCVQSIVDVQNKYVVYGPDNKTFATVSLDYGELKVWNFPPLQELIDQTCERFKDRPLTEEEKKLYYLE